MTSRRIVIVVGTDHHPFQRLVAWADERQRAGDRVLVQYGQSMAPAVAEGHAFLDPGRLRDEMAGAEVVITHGGPGTISDARRSGHRPIVVPRDPALGEHVDDHQQRFSAWCAERDVVELARTLPELERLLDGGVSTRTSPMNAAQTERAVATFAELVARPEVSRRSAPAGAPRVLWVPEGATPERVLDDLLRRDDVVLLGRLSALGPGRLIAAVCACGQPVRECPVWSAVAETSARDSELGSELPRDLARLAARRYPGRNDRRRLLDAGSPFQALLAAVSAATGDPLLVVEGSWSRLALLSHDRRLDLTVAGPVRGLAQRILVARRRLRVQTPAGVPRGNPARLPQGHGADASLTPPRV